MTTFDTFINNAIISIQIILVFVSILFNIFYININEKINKRLSDISNDENRAYLNELKQSRLIGIILTFILLLIIVLFLPIFIEIFHQFFSNFPNSIQLTFDILRPLFVIITFSIFIFFILTIWKIKSLCTRIKYVEIVINNEEHE